MTTEDPGLFQGVTIFLLLLMLGGALLFATQQNREDMRFQLRLFIISFVARFALSVFIYQFGLIAVVGDEDASGWANGAFLMEKWRAQGVSLLTLPGAILEGFNTKGQHTGYRYLLGTFFFLTDTPYRLSAAALNGFFGALVVVFTYRIARALFSPWVAAHVGWWTCYFPSMLIFSAMTIKEPVVVLLETLALYGCIRIREGGLSVRHLLLTCLTCVLLLPFRFYASYLVVVSIVVALILPELFRPKRAFSSMLMLVILVPLVAAAGSFAKVEKQFENFDMDRVQSFRDNVATGGTKAGARSGVKVDADMRTPGGFLVGTAVGAAHLALAPFPWQLGGASLRMALTLPELLYWWWLFFVGLIPGFRYCLRHRFRDVLVLLLFIVGFGLLYAMMFGNVGLVFRQRAQLYPWLFVFAAVGLEQRMLLREAVTRLRRGGPMLADAAP